MINDDDNKQILYIFNDNVKEDPRLQTKITIYLSKKFHYIKNNLEQNQLIIYYENNVKMKQLETEHNLVSIDPEIADNLRKERKKSISAGGKPRKRPKNRKTYKWKKAQSIMA